jgi:3-oxoadipate enol-lactonase
VSIKNINYRTKRILTALYSIDPFPCNTKPILLLHGLGSDATSWQLQMEPLANAGFRPIAIDIPGFGKSSYPYRRWNIRKASLIIIHEMMEQFSSPIVLMGLSMGGTIAQTIYSYRPDSISKMILASTFAKLRLSPGQNLPYLTRRLAQMAVGDITKQAGTVSDRIFPSPEQKVLHDYLFDQVQRANPVIYRQSMISLGLFNSTHWMKKCKIPVLVISGREDSTVTLKNQTRLSRIIPESQHFVIDNGGHAVSVDHPELFNHAMLEFLQQN